VDQGIAGGLTTSEHRSGQLRGMPGETRSAKHEVHAGLGNSVTEWSGNYVTVDTLGIYARTTAENDRKASDLVGEIFRPRDGRATEMKNPAKRQPRNSR
jgi:hypothetical protein